MSLETFPRQFIAFPMGSETTSLPVKTSAIALILTSHPEH